MRYTVTRQRVQVLGHIWQPGVGLCAAILDVSDYDLSPVEDLRDRESVADRVNMLAGDFREVVDFRADFHLRGEHIVHEWARGEESEATFNDLYCLVDE